MYEVLNPQPELEEGETAVKLSEGDLVAVSVSTERQPNNEGLAITARARAINADGSKRLCPNGDPIVTKFTHRSNADEIASLSQTVVLKDMLKAVLGEPLEALSFSTLVLDSTSIRNAIICAEASAVPHPVELL